MYISLNAMKTLFLWVTALISLGLNAQDIRTPETTVIGLFVATDQQNWTEVANSFHEKVWLDYTSMNGNPGSESTPQEIISAWKSILPGFEHTHHQLGNTISTIKGEKAKVFCYGTASHYLTDDGGNLWLVVGTYDFDLILQDEGDWRITSMTFDYKYQEGNTGLPEKAMNQIK